MNEVVNVDINKLIPYINNPRYNDLAVPAVAESIAQFGFQQPIVVDRDMVVIAGHTRLKAAKMLGYTEVPVVVAPELTSDQARAYRLIDNKTGELSEWEQEKLQEEISDIVNSNIQFDYDFFGEGSSDMTNIAATYEEEETDEEEDEDAGEEKHVICPRCGGIVE